ncbi:MAG: pyridoxamine 5'-phosphate oxidase family protein [Gemmatimonadaceae bacterium]
MSDSHTPDIHPIDRAAIDAILERNRVGRIAFTFRDRVDIQPIHYVFHDGWIYGRTSAGSKLRTILHNCWVAFEVDEVEGLFRWRSVVAHGACYVLDPEGSPHERESYERAVELLRTLLPETLTSADPVAFRSTVFRIHIDDVTGREARDGR